MALRMSGFSPRLAKVAVSVVFSTAVVVFASSAVVFVIDTLFPYV
jgi:hypothetical protein